MNRSWIKWLLIGWCISTSAFGAGLDEGLTELQRDWAQIRYQVQERERVARFESLAEKAHQLSARFPGRSEPLVWEGIILSSLAGEKGGLGALSLVKQAKQLYEQAIAMDGHVLDGSAYNSLGVLYYKVPAWPIGFGDKDKAKSMLTKALAINPNGIDSNYFYAEFLYEQDRPDEALNYLERALKSPPRPGRSLADAGRKDEVLVLMKKIKGG